MKSRNKMWARYNILQRDKIHFYNRVNINFVQLQLLYKQNIKAYSTTQNTQKQIKQK